jgi:hypothetical protein
VKGASNGAGGAGRGGCSGFEARAAIFTGGAEPPRRALMALGGAHALAVLAFARLGRLSGWAFR